VSLATVHAVQHLLHDYPRTICDLSGLDPESSLGLSLAAAHAVQPPRLTIMRTI
jgi:hypothetical protein